MEKLLETVEKYKDLILSAERYIWAHPETGYREINTSKYMAEKFRELAMLILLLENGGERAKKIKADFKPKFASKEEYFDYIEKLRSSGERITYNDDGSVTVKP